MGLYKYLICRVEKGKMNINLEMTNTEFLIPLRELAISIIFNNLNITYNTSNIRLPLLYFFNKYNCRPSCDPSKTNLNHLFYLKINLLPTSLALFEYGEQTSNNLSRQQLRRWQRCHSGDESRYGQPMSL